MKKGIEFVRKINMELREFSCCGIECEECVFDISSTCMHGVLVDITNAVYGRNYNDE